MAGTKSLRSSVVASQEALEATDRMLANLPKRKR
jgi:hypothetical protein